jgi:hypothetical protein
MGFQSRKWDSSGSDPSFRNIVSGRLNRTAGPAPAMLPMRLPFASHLAW